ncbi:hypothetical protein G1C96_0704 [Bifidobacterium sp. DSM 109958]|uniref:Zinc-ribbon domain-containing protein n=1 Tax=Bifidobacterium moraviense TaxID=2675323 RepID=A0A7Y0HY61_9BIFI|nr:zinc ribbon domain-containing protein [Bifidobacterium sp. DSM 109958]NMN00127.1 hypothetical protein [Bifidobacterium sp. DSM 109958]
MNQEFCSRCGSSITGGTTVCPQCGAYLGDGAAHGGEEQATHNSSTPPSMIPTPSPEPVGGGSPESPVKSHTKAKTKINKPVAVGIAVLCAAAVGFSAPSFVTTYWRYRGTSAAVTCQNSVAEYHRIYKDANDIMKSYYERTGEFANIDSATASRMDDLIKAVRDASRMQSQTGQDVYTGYCDTDNTANALSDWSASWENFAAQATSYNDDVRKTIAALNTACNALRNADDKLKHGESITDNTDKGTSDDTATQGTSSSDQKDASPQPSQSGQPSQSAKPTQSAQSNQSAQPVDCSAFVGTYSTWLADVTIQVKADCTHSMTRYDEDGTYVAQRLSEPISEGQGIVSMSDPRADEKIVFIPAGVTYAGNPAANVYDTGTRDPGINSFHDITDKQRVLMTGNGMTPTVYLKQTDN